MIEYRLIPGCQSHYAGSDGILYARLKRGRYKPLKTSICKRTGYHKASFAEGAQRFMNSAHFFIALAWLGERPDPAQQVRHDNGDRLDNRPGNLLWGSALENALDRARHGTQVRGSLCSWAKLTERKVKNIRALALSGLTTAELARRYRVSKCAMRAAIRGKTWIHV